MAIRTGKVHASAAIATLACLGLQPSLSAQPQIKRVPKSVTRLVKPHDYSPPSGTPQPNVMYFGGALVAHASYWMIYWGPYWTSGLGLVQRKHFNSFVQTVAPSSGFTGQFAEYQEPGNPILAAGFAGEILIAAAPSGAFDYTQIENQIDTWITNNVLPVPDANTVYVIMAPPGADMRNGGQPACGYFFGYHYAGLAPAGTFGRYRYIVLPYQDCGADIAADGPVAVNGMTDTLSHEMAETETDPDGFDTFAYGWYDYSTGNEIADICADTSATLGYQYFWFQKVWSVAQETCIGPLAGNSSIHLTISAMEDAFPGLPEPSGAANITEGFPLTFNVSTDSQTPVGLSVGGMPSGVTYKLSSSTVTAADPATLQISANSSPGPNAIATVTATLNSQQAQFQFQVIPWQLVSTLKVTNTAFTYSASTRLYTGTITVENTGAQPIGPTILVGYHGLDSTISTYVVGSSNGARASLEVGPTGDYAVQFPDGMLAPGQSVTQSVGFSNPNSVAINFTPQTFVIQTSLLCDIAQDGRTSVTDVQQMINEAFGLQAPTDDLNADGAVNITDIELVINDALGFGCFTAPIG